MQSTQDRRRAEMGWKVRGANARAEGLVHLYHTVKEIDDSIFRALKVVFSILRKLENLILGNTVF